MPLSRQALALLESLPRLGPYVFTGRGEQAMRGFHSRKEKIDALLDPPIDYDLHDLRRTTRTGLARLRVPESTAERVLGHTQRGIERHYNMHHYADEKAAGAAGLGRPRRGGRHRPADEGGPAPPRDDVAAEHRRR